MLDLKSWLSGKGEAMKRLLLASIATCCFLSTVQSATAKGCLEGAVLGGAVGHMTHHTFLGIFGGCAGGLYVHHLYAKWHRGIQTVTLINLPKIIRAGFLRAGMNV